MTFSPMTGLWRAVVDALPAFSIDPAAEIILRRTVAQLAALRDSNLADSR